MTNLTLLTSLAPWINQAQGLAYLDPGTGSYALQLLLAGVFGGMFALKQSWQHWRAKFLELKLARRGPASTLEPTD